MDSTQLANYVALIGFVLKLLKVNIGTEEVTQALTASMVLGGLFVSWYNRYKQGDLTLSGFKKTS